MKKIKFFVPILMVLMFGFIQLPGQNSEKIAIHGFGGWAYGNTNGNHYLFGSKEGDYDHSQFYLNINANPFERLSIIAQIGAMHGEDGLSFEFDYAFAEWTISDLFKLRFGKIKHPFGIFGEIFSVGTVRPFLTLPQSIYGPHGYVGKSYNGIGATGSVYSKNGWGISYDIYWGQLKAETQIPNMVGYIIKQEAQYLNDEVMIMEKDTVDLIGGRLILSTPLDGLSAGVSAYSGEDKQQEAAGAGGYSGDQKSFGVHLEYLTANFWLRSEYLKHTMNATTGQTNLETISDCFYIEAAYRFLNHWQVAVRYDWSESDIIEIDESILPLFFQEYMKHKDISFGLNYWFQSNLVLKASYHIKSGIRFSFPNFTNPMAFLQGQFDNETNLIMVGVHYSF